MLYAEEAFDNGQSMINFHNVSFLSCIQWATSHSFIGFLVGII